MSQAQEVWSTLQSCSMLVGMHPDQAAEPLVDFAIRSGKPFACVPCCVYSKQAPWRKLRDGQPVSSYEDFVEYLVEKLPPGTDGTDSSGICVQDLDFEGKNKVVYWRGRA
jgi:hypothetical protein